jgi:hypothetical protein
MKSVSFRFLNILISPYITSNEQNYRDFNNWDINAISLNCRNWSLNASNKFCLGIFFRKFLAVSCYFSTLPQCLSRAKSAVTLPLSHGYSNTAHSLSHPCIPFTNLRQPDSKLVNRFFGHEWMNESSTSGPFSTRIVICFWKFFNGKKEKHCCCHQSKVLLPNVFNDVVKVKRLLS